MSAVLEVTRLSKTYPKFQLKDVSFTLPEGSIMGFIGRNGAGKTTTLKSILGLVHPDAGCVRCFGMNLAEHAREVKQRIGFFSSAIDYYRRKKISDMIDVTKRFYDNWDGEEYQKYLRVFHLDTEKTPAELPEGMRVKLGLLLALSHRARLLILDEPTSGLDPASRAELTGTFRFLKRQGVSILFSTQIISDLERCADYITYIRDGEIIASEAVGDFIIFHRQLGFGSNLEEIMVRYEREALSEKPAE